MTGLTLLAVVVHGYHPYAEDGGLYLPEIKRLLHPELYPWGAEFVVEHLRFSIFAPVMAGLVRWSHLRLETVLLLVHVGSFWMTLYAAWLLAARCFEGREARLGAVSLLAVWMTLPVAGTSLMLMDPYVTARSFSTPCTLLALVGALVFLMPRQEDDDAGRRGERGRGLALCGGALAAGGAMHPLMGVYGLGCALVLGSVLCRDRRMRVWGTVGLCVSAVVAAGALQMAAGAEDAAYRGVALTRYYWFLSQWHWYELMGLAAPLGIVAAVAFGRSGLVGKDAAREDAARVGLARMAFVVGGTAVAIAGLFAREGLATHEVARLQPLRVFQVVYVVMILMVGANFGERLLRRSGKSIVRWVVTLSLLAGVMIFAERTIYPASARLELPWRWSGEGLPENAWEQAFVWIRRNTPEDALFAIDPHYITQPGEDAQGFRAIAERSVLPDYSKDGGVVANEPWLSGEWMEGEAVQARLNSESDAARVAALKPLGVGWMVLDSQSETRFRCEYRNAVVKVCRLR